MLGPSITPRPPQGQPLVAFGWTTEADLALARAADVVFVPAETGFAGVVVKLRGDGQGTRPKIIADLQVRPDVLSVGELVAAAQTSVAQGAQGIRLILPDPHRQIAFVIDTLLPALHAELLVGPSLGGDLRTSFGLPAARNRYAAAA